MAAGSDDNFIKQFKQFFRTYYHEEIKILAHQYPDKSRSLYIDYAHVAQFDDDFAKAYLTNPNQVQEDAEEALRRYELPTDATLDCAHVRPYNLPEITDIRDIRISKHQGKLLSIQGEVQIITDLVPHLNESVFECQRCGTVTSLSQPDGKFKMPGRCRGCERKDSSQFDFDQSKFIDSQQIRIQGHISTQLTDEAPQYLDIILKDDIINTVSPGESIIVVGVPHFQQILEDSGNSSIIDLSVDAVSVTDNKRSFDVRTA